MMENDLYRRTEPTAKDYLDIKKTPTSEESQSIIDTLAEINTPPPEFVVGEMLDGHYTVYSTSGGEYHTVPPNLPLIKEQAVSAAEYITSDRVVPAQNKTEKALKRLINYSKTPMERKHWEIELNKFYKERKKKKC